MAFQCETVLQQLQLVGEMGTTTERLAASTGMPRDSVRRAVFELRSLGFTISPIAGTKLIRLG